MTQKTTKNEAAQKFLNSNINSFKEIREMTEANRQERLKRKNEVGSKKTPFSQVVLNNKHDDQDDDIEDPDDDNDDQIEHRPMKLVNYDSGENEEEET